MANKEIINKLLKLKDEIKEISLKEKELRKKYDDLLKECKHEYIIIYDKTKDGYGFKNYKFCCLTCGAKCYKCDERFIKELKNEPKIFCVDITNGFHQEKILSFFENFLDVETENKIKQAQEIFFEYFNEFKNNEELLKYKLKKEILEKVAGKKIKTKIIIKN